MTSDEFIQICADFLMMKSDAKPNTLSTYSSIITNHIIPYAEIILYDNEDESCLYSQIEEIIAEDDTISDASKLQVLSVLRAICTLGNIPAQKTDYIKKSEKEVRYLDSAEIQTIKAGSYGHRYRIAIMLGLYAGLRIGEISALRICDIDLYSDMIHVSHSLNRNVVSEGRTEVILDLPKTAKSDRIIGIGYDLKQEIKQHIETYNVKAGYLLNNGGKPVEPRTLSRYFSRLCEKYEIENTTFHTLRHTFASMCLSKGMNIKMLTDIMGHASAATTIDTYCHLTEYQSDKMKTYMP